MTDLTLKQAADQLGLTKNTVKGRLKDQPDLTYKGSDGLIYVTEAGLNWLAESVAEKGQTSSGTEETTDTQKQTDSDPILTDLVELLRNQLEVKDKQIESLQNQLETVTAALQAAQALHAMEKKEQQRLPDPDPEQRPWWHFWRRTPQN